MVQDIKQFQDVAVLSVSIGGSLVAIIMYTTTCTGTYRRHLRPMVRKDLTRVMNIHFYSVKLWNIYTLRRPNLGPGCHPSA